jgi:tRNA(Met) cytidine acetyltransferase
VNAHYQTTPNDLVHILQDPQVHLFVCQDCDGRSIGCVLVNLEGGVEPELAVQIMAGKRRPKGQLVAGTIACQLGFEQGITQAGLRIMRIAVQPEYQQQSIGSWMLNQLRNQQYIEFDYIATSYGVTPDLLHFWGKNGFIPLRLGAQRDQASGTHSLLMIDRSIHQLWIEQAYTGFVYHFSELLHEVFSELEPELVVAILSASAHYFAVEDRRQAELVQKYCQGNCLYESVYSYSRRLALSLLSSRPNSSDQDVSVIVAKLLQSRSWQEVAQRFGFAGRKETEQQLRKQLYQLLQFTV